MKIFIQKLGKSLMAPLSIIVAAGLLLGIASTLKNPLIFGNTLSGIPAISGFIGLVNSLVGQMFGLLPILFCISVAIGMARDDKEVSAFSAIIGFVLFHVTIQYFLSLKGITGETVSVDYLTANGATQEAAVKINSMYETTFGIFTYRMSVFGGIITGIWTAEIHNRFHRTQLPVALSFFSGKRFVPIMITVTIPVLSVFMFFVWPLFSTCINAMGSVIQGSGAFGTFIYGFLERLLIPTGLHHILNQLVRFTPIGGTAVIDGEQVSGALTIFNTLLMNPDPDLGTMRQATRFLTQGTHPFKVYGLPAACYAMYKTALPKNKDKVKGVLFAAALTSFLTGITEPIEFSFIFISPILFLFHAFMAGLSFLINTLLGVMIGNAGGGLIDLTIFGILRGTETKWYLNVLVGIVYAIIYYHVFKFAILKFNIKTPGREDENESEEIEEISAGELGNAVMEALGGKSNIKEIDNCISRLRLVLNNTKLADEKKLKATGSLGVIKIDEHNIQVVYGTKVEKVAFELKRSYRSGAKESQGKEEFLSPMTGKLIAMEDVPDPAFSSKAMGDGFAVEMKEGIVAAPVSGELVSVFPTGHAYGIRTSNGMEVLIHIGIDTVELQGKGFDIRVKQGDHVKQGDILACVDLEYVKKQGKAMISPVVFTTGENVNVKKTGKQIKLLEKDFIDIL